MNAECMATASLGDLRWDQQSSAQQSSAQIKAQAQAMQGGSMVNDSLPALERILSALSMCHERSSATASHIEMLLERAYGPSRAIPSAGASGKACDADRPVDQGKIADIMERLEGLSSLLNRMETLTIRLDSIV